MTLLWIVAIPLVAGAAAPLAALFRPQLSRWVALVATLADLALLASVWGTSVGGDPGLAVSPVDWPWIEALGIRFHLALDGLSLMLLLLTFFLGAVAVLASWREIEHAVGFYYLNLLWILAGIAGVFLAANLLLFYFAWELMLVPMYFLISIWGHENRGYAAIKFFVFTQFGGLLLLVAILALYFQHHYRTGAFTFEYGDLLFTPMSFATEMWIMLGFFLGFAVKLPVLFLHTWLPDAHTEAPTAGSVILAGLLLKTGAYGVLRFVLPLFPHASAEFAPVAMWLGVGGILYGAWLAFGQSDLKRLVAYTSVSHLGFVLLGIYAWNTLSLQGALLTMICHGVSTGALFVIAGLLQGRIHTRSLERMGGLWDAAPRLSGAGLFFALASLGLPGLGDFIGEFLVLLGTFQKSVPLAALAALGVLFATFYALRLVQRAFWGPNDQNWRFPDLTLREGIMIASMVSALLWLGLYPQPVIDTWRPVVVGLDRVGTLVDERTP